MKSVTTNSPAETVELGKEIGRRLRGGEIIALTGQLGSGKTHLIKGIAAGAGVIQTRDVNSPTFVIVNEYCGNNLDIYHIDAYRLENTGQFDSLGFDDMCYANSVVLVEWADKVESALNSTEHIEIKIFHSGTTQREIEISGLF